MDTSLRLRAIEVLSTGSAAEKVALTRQHVAWWRSTRDRRIVGPNDDVGTPEPQRDITEVRRGREKKAGLKGFVHSLAHAECCAIDCFWDLLARFGHDIERRLGDEAAAFADDVCAIALDEATHFERLAARLDALGVAYGDLSATDTLGASMVDTADDILARLAIVHLVHEARGLDVYDVGKARLDRAGDDATAAVLDQNYHDEVTHVALMLKWFVRLAGPNAQAQFHAIVRDRRRWKQQGLKGPFNHHARERAGMPPDWYAPLELLH